MVVEDEKEDVNSYLKTLRKRRKLEFERRSAISLCLENSLYLVEGAADISLDRLHNE